MLSIGSRDLVSRLHSSDFPISLLDLAPTIVSLFTGEATAIQMQGRSLLQPADAGRVVFAHAPERVFAFGADGGVSLGSPTGETASGGMSLSEAAGIALDGSDVEPDTNLVLHATAFALICEDDREELFSDESEATRLPAIARRPATPMPWAVWRRVSDELRGRTPVWIDIGCGRAKRPGFFGIDGRPQEGVDLVAELDTPLPLLSDFADYVYASHSLEHVRDLPFTMAEIHRVCRHGAQVTIVAPYYNTFLNFANPYHLQVFNEHTPRFFTPEARSLLADEVFPLGPRDVWGLAESDHRIAALDMRCFNLEYFYFPEYRDLPPEEQHRLRQTTPNVVDQIAYSLVVIKQPATEEEIKSMTQHLVCEEPPRITLRRARERQARAEREIEQLRENIEMRKQAQGRLEENLEARKQTHAQLEEKLETLRAELGKIVELSESRRQRVETAEQSLREVQRELDERAASLQTMREKNLRLDGELNGAVKQGKTLTARVGRLEGINRELFRSYQAERARRSSRLVLHLRHLLFGAFDDLRERLKPAAREFVESGVLKGGIDPRRFIVSRSPYIEAKSAVEYSIPEEAGRSGALSVVFGSHASPYGDGTIRVEILNGGGAPLRTVGMKTADLEIERPTTIRFDPISDAQGLRVRVSGGEGAQNAGLFLYEWQRCSRLTGGVVERRLLGRAG